MRDALPEVQNIKILLSHGNFQIINCVDIVLLEPDDNTVAVDRLRRYDPN